MLAFLNPRRLKNFDRIQWVGIILVGCFLGVLLLSGQSQASYPTYLLALLMLASAPQWWDVFKIGLVRWIVALMSWLCLSAFWSDDFVLRDAVSVWTRAILIFCFVVAFAESLQRGQLQKWLGWALTIAGAAAVLAATVNFFLSKPEDGRLNGLGQLDTHVVAALVYGVVLLFVVRTLRASPYLPYRALGLMTALVVGCAVFLSDSRNAWVSVSFGLLVYLLSFYCNDRRQFVVTVASVVLLAGVSLLVLVSDATYSQLLLPRGDSFRMAIWSVTIDQIFNDSVVLGRGILSDDNVTVGGLEFQHPHNLYLALLFQGGLVAVMLFSMVVFKALQLAFRFYEDEDAKFALGILTLALSSYLLDGHELLDKVGDTWFLFWLPIGILLGLGWKTVLSDRRSFFIA